MLIKSFLYVLTFCGVSLVLCVVGVVISYYLQGSDTAKELFFSWVLSFNGILVGGFGYGLTWFIRGHGKLLLSQLNEVITIPAEVMPKVIVHARRANSMLWKSLIGIPLTIVGGIILWSCDYPLDGFAKIYLAICSISIYFCGFLYSHIFHLLVDAFQVLGGFPQRSGS